MKVEVCTWGPCKWKFSKYIVKRLENDIEKFWYKRLNIHESPCMWSCQKWPNVKINKGDIQNRSDPAKISNTVRNELLKKK